MREKGTDESWELVEGHEVGLITCGRGEGVQGCPHSLLQRSSAGCLPCTSVEELREQLEVEEEEDGGRQEEEEEVEREKRVKESAPWMSMQMGVMKALRT